MKKLNVFSAIILFFTLQNCKDTNASKKDKIEPNIQPQEILTDLELKSAQEQIYLFATAKQLSYDTLYQIFRDYSKDYYQNKLSQKADIFNISIEKMDSCLLKISKKYNLPKSKVAELIYSYRFKNFSIIED